MTRLMAVLLDSMVALACSNPSNNDGGGGGAGGAAGGGGGGLEPWGLTVLDPNATELTYLAMAVDPAQERVGVLYYTPNGTQMSVTLDGGAMQDVPNYDLKYVEWKQGVVTGPERLRQMQRMEGLALAFNPANGHPYAAYLGGAPGFIPGQSIYWFQNDAVYAERTAADTWPETTVATTGDQVTCPDPVSNRGFLVGLFPAIAFDPTGKLYFAYRDGHDAQFPIQDWGGSDVEAWEGTPGGALTPQCVYSGGGAGKRGNGGRIKMAMGAGNLPIITYDLVPESADGPGHNVLAQRRTAAGWTGAAEVYGAANTQSGASVAYDACQNPVPPATCEGYGIAVFDVSTSQLTYLRSADGATWQSPDPVYGLGTGGWWPSLAMDPAHHEPAIAFYVCDQRQGITDPTNCRASDDELRVMQRVGGLWRSSTVDPEGGYLPQLGFFASGKRVVAYKDKTTGAVKLAVER